MNALPEPTAINEIDAAALQADPRWTQAAQPWVARSLVDDWPLVSAANEDDSAFLDYLLGFYSGNQVSAFLGEADIGGRFFYNEALDGFNFLQVQTTLNHLNEQLRALANDESPPSLYMGSTNLHHWLPGLSDKPATDRSCNRSPASGCNHSLIAPHFDFPSNIACCVAGGGIPVIPARSSRQPVCGAWDLTPAGQAISLVDTATLICSCTEFRER